MTPGAGDAILFNIKTSHDTSWVIPRLPGIPGISSGVVIIMQPGGGELNLGGLFCFPPG